MRVGRYSGSAASAACKQRAASRAPSSPSSRARGGGGAQVRRRRARVALAARDERRRAFARGSDGARVAVGGGEAPDGGEPGGAAAVDGREERADARPAPRLLDERGEVERVAAAGRLVWRLVLERGDDLVGPSLLGRDPETREGPGRRGGLGVTRRRVQLERQPGARLSAREPRERAPRLGRERAARERRQDVGRARRLAEDLERLGDAQRLRVVAHVDVRRQTRHALGRAARAARDARERDGQLARDHRAGLGDGDLGREIARNRALASEGREVGGGDTQPGVLGGRARGGERRRRARVRRRRLAQQQRERHRMSRRLVERGLEAGHALVARARRERLRAPDPPPRPRLRVGEDAHLIGEPGVPIGRRARARHAARDREQALELARPRRREPVQLTDGGVSRGQREELGGALRERRAEPAARPELGAELQRRRGVGDAARPRVARGRRPEHGRARRRLDGGLKGGAHR